MGRGFIFYTRHPLLFRDKKSVSAILAPQKKWKEYACASRDCNHEESRSDGWYNHRDKCEAKAITVRVMRVK